MTSKRRKFRGPPQADAAKRIVAFVFDGALAFGLFLVLDLLTWHILAWLAACAFLVFRDALPGFGRGVSPGKHLMDLRTVCRDGGPLTLELALKRNFPLALGLIAASVLGGLLSLLPIFGGALSFMVWVLALGLTVGIELYEVITRKGPRVGDLLADTYVADTAPRGELA